MTADADLYEVDELPELKILEPDSIVAERYRIIEVLGKGGMGVVYKAEHIHMNRFEALKMMLQASSAAAAAQDLRRFQREAKAASLLNHPNIVAIHDFGIFEGSAYLCMDYLEGQSLDFVLAKKPLTLEQFRHIFAQACDALQHAHEKGIVHRDLKPSNIMITERRNDPNYVMILDFGLVKLIQGSGDHKLTATNMVIGSPLYMSPEQCRAVALDHRSDIYSLGCVMYESLTGTPPFLADTVFDVMNAHISKETVPMKDRRQGLYVPTALEKVISKAMAKDPAARYQSMSDLAKAIEDSFSGAPELAVSASTLTKASNTQAAAKKSSRRRRDRNLVLAGWSIIAGLLLVIAGVLFFNSINSHSPDRVASKIQSETNGTVRPGQLGTKPIEPLSFSNSIPSGTASPANPSANGSSSIGKLPPPPVSLNSPTGKTEGHIPVAIPPVNPKSAPSADNEQSRAQSAALPPAQATFSSRPANSSDADSEQLLRSADSLYQRSEWSPARNKYLTFLNLSPSPKNDDQTRVYAKLTVIASNLGESTQDYLSRFKYLFNFNQRPMEDDPGTLYKLAKIAGREDLSFLEKILRTTVSGYERIHRSPDRNTIMLKMELSKVCLEEGKQSDADSLLAEAARDAAFVAPELVEDAKRHLAQIRSRLNNNPEFSPLPAGEGGGYGGGYNGPPNGFPPGENPGGFLGPPGLRRGPMRGGGPFGAEPGGGGPIGGGPMGGGPFGGGPNGGGSR